MKRKSKTNDKRTDIERIYDKKLKNSKSDSKIIIQEQKLYKIIKKFGYRRDWKKIYGDSNKEVQKGVSKRKKGKRRITKKNKRQKNKKMQLK